jgi:hypothetical protein
MIVKFLVLSISIIYAALLMVYYKFWRIGWRYVLEYRSRLFSFNGFTSMNVVIILFAIVVIALLVLCILLVLAGSGSNHYPDIDDLNTSWRVTLWRNMFIMAKSLLANHFLSIPVINWTAHLNPWSLLNQGFSFPWTSSKTHPGRLILCKSFYSIHVFFPMILAGSVFIRRCQSDFLFNVTL